MIQKGRQDSAIGLLAAPAQNRTHLRPRLLVMAAVTMVEAVAVKPEVVTAMGVGMAVMAMATGEGTAVPVVAMVAVTVTEMGTGTGTGTGTVMATVAPVMAVRIPASRAIRSIPATCRCPTWIHRFPVARMVSGRQG
ncbi:hypothetical protein [Stenotrophomonas maltophilia]|uniref:hypothetical protein n=1 Tax=Stenotrophomonas maltophilia TaxID=40324 RepID=UPI001B31266B|nr:hypothetical protein [Stenotrophomonas maltophilia]